MEEASKEPEIPLEFERRADHSPHEWPQWTNDNPDVCACCTEKILHGYQNVLRVEIAAEVVTSVEGEVLGVEDNKPRFRQLHVRCAERHFGRKIECEKCGTFVVAKTLADGRRNPCLCTCHTGSKHCSLILDPNVNNPLRKLK